MEKVDTIDISKNLMDVTVPNLFEFQKTKKWTAYTPHACCKKEECEEADVNKMEEDEY